MRRRSAVLVALSILVLSCGPKSRRQVEHERARTAPRRQVAAEIEDLATDLVVGMCDDLVRGGCLSVSRLDCRQLLRREVSSCASLAIAELGERVSGEEALRWETYFFDCAGESVRSLVDFEQPECRRALR